MSELRFDLVTRDEASQGLARMAEAAKGAAEASASLQRAITDLTEEEDVD